MPRSSLVHSVALTLGMVSLASPPLARGQEEKKTEPDAKANEYRLTFSGAIEPKLAPVVGKLAEAFYEGYPRLVERFGNPDKPAPRRIEVEFRRGLRVPAQCSGSKVQVSVEWLEKHPDDIGMLTHELTHAVQAYPRGGPGWMTEGIADYARALYGPKEQPGWSLPTRLTEKHSYRDSYRVTARFFLWLDERYPGSVDKLHRRMQVGEFELADFKTVTDSDLDTLWDECVKALSIENNKCRLSFIE